MSTFQRGGAFVPIETSILLCGSLEPRYIDRTLGYDSVPGFARNETPISS
jgi:hypothetical protein